MTFNINDFPFSKATNASSTNTVTGTSWQTILSVPDNEYWLASYVRADKWDGTWTYTAIGYYSVESGLTIQMEDFAQTGGVKAFRQRLAMGPGDGLALYVDAHSVDGDAAMSVAVEVFSAPT